MDCDIVRVRDDLYSDLETTKTACMSSICVTLRSTPWRIQLVLCARDLPPQAPLTVSKDRVFAHALNTVKRIPPLGSARPPPSDRYRLYGLYKQSMEGDVDRVMERPTGRGEDQAKWDAWNSQKELSRTEAKRQYISTLIDTMHRYASQTPYVYAIDFA